MATKKAQADRLAGGQEKVAVPEDSIGERRGAQAG
jgi:hypothetical protein